MGKVKRKNRLCRWWSAIPHMLEYWVAMRCLSAWLSLKDVTDVLVLIEDIERFYLAHCETG